MPKTANELITDALVRHQVYLQRLAGQIRNGMTARIDSTIDQLSGFLLKQDQLQGLSPLTKAYAIEIDRLGRQLKKLRDPGFAAAKKYADSQFAQLIDNEAEFTANAITSGIGEKIAMGAIPPTVVDNILALGAWNGMTLQTWYSKWQQGDLDRIVNAVRSGIAGSKTLDEITRGIVGTKKLNYTDGILQSTRNGAETLARTITNGVTNSAREELYKRNSDIITGWRYTATLDGRTSEICASRDGNVYTMEDRPELPAHPNCRSVYTPVISGFGIVGERPAVGGTNFREEAKTTYINKQKNKGTSEADAKAKWNNLSNSSKNKLQNEQISKWDKNTIGTVPAKTTYNEFLSRQPKAFQVDVLGKTKAEIFRRGGTDKNGNPVTVSTFIDQNNGKPYTIAQLKQREPQLFKQDKTGE